MSPTDHPPADILEQALPVVVLCPPVAGEPVPRWFDECRTSVIAHGMRCVCPDAGAPAGSADPEATVVARWVAEVAAAVRAGSGGLPLILVCEGTTARVLPALAVSQRAARHSIVGYVLVDVDVPAVDALGGEWLGAPVTYVRSPGAADLGWRAAELHGWHCTQTEPGLAVLEAAARAGGGLAGLA